MRASGIHGWVDFDGATITVRDSFGKTSVFDLESITGSMVRRSARLGLGQVVFASTDDEAADGLTTDCAAALSFLPWQQKAVLKLHAAASTAYRRCATLA
jgi:hypothetical protein